MTSNARSASAIRYLGAEPIVIVLETGALYEFSPGDVSQEVARSDIDLLMERADFELIPVAEPASEPSGS